jgi:hypothetical protein
MRFLSLFGLFVLLVAPACSENGLQSFPEGEVGPGVPPGPRIAVQPTAIDYGEIGIDCDDDALIRITNVGVGELFVELPEFAGTRADSFSADWTESLRLGADESAEIPVSFVAGAFGTHSATLTITSNDPVRPEVGVELLGEGANTATMRVDDFSQKEESKVDVLFVIDTSGSMSGEQDNVAQNISSFYQWFEPLQLDFHMGVITADDSDPNWAGKLIGTNPRFISDQVNNGAAALGQMVTTDGGGGEAGLGAMVLALSEPLLSGHNQGFYRDEAFLSVIFLSDEPEQSTQSSQYYIDWLVDLKGDPSMISVSAIVGPRSGGCFGNCGGFSITNAEAGPKYIDVQEAYPGVYESICTCDFSPALEAIGYASVGFRSVFPLSAVPTDPSRITVTVNGQPTLLWSYDAAQNAVIFSANGIPGSLATIFIEYPVDGGCAD